MIITKAPLRMSFVGGGSDASAFYNKSTGMVISTAINKFVYVAINPKFSGGFRISYSQTEHCSSVDDIQHPIVRECLKYFNISDGLEIVSMADIPSSGTGLGSSSSFTVALLKALHHLKGELISDHELAKLACDIEIHKCGEPIGKQDQYAAAVGGMNKLVFNMDDTVASNPIELSDQFKLKFERHIALFYTGVTRSASTILRNQNSQISTKSATFNVVEKMVQTVDLFEEALVSEDIAALGKLIHENWQLKVKLSSSISDSWITDTYQKAISEGAFGGKILGAGAGGFFMFLAPPELHPHLADVTGLEKYNFKLEDHGCRVIFSQ